MLVMLPAARVQKRPTRVVPNQGNMTNRPKVKSQGCSVWGEAHKAIIEVFMDTATMREETNYSPHDPRNGLKTPWDIQLSHQEVSNTRKCRRSCQKINNRLV